MSATRLRKAKALLVRGLATVDIVNGVPDEYIAASRKALDADQVPEFERSVGSIYDQMALIWIQPQWARFFDFGVGREGFCFVRQASTWTEPGSLSRRTRSKSEAAPHHNPPSLPFRIARPGAKALTRRTAGATFSNPAVTIAAESVRVRAEEPVRRS